MKNYTGRITGVRAKSTTEFPKLLFQNMNPKLHGKQKGESKKSKRFYL